MATSSILYQDMVLINTNICYNKKFALIPVHCGHEWVWFKYYYIKIETERYGNPRSPTGPIYYIEIRTKLTAKDYIIEKLTHGI